MRAVFLRSIPGLLLGVAAPACSPIQNPDATTTDASSTSTSGVAGMCGWDPHNNYYQCGFDGESPTSTFPRMCPEGLVEGAACGQIGGEGCCDAENDVWFCGDGGEGDSKDKLVEIQCE